MHVLIIEDEAPAAARLRKMLSDVDVLSVEVLEVLDTVAGARAWLQQNPAPELIFMDIQLSDGLSLDLMRELKIGCPVIFVTAYDTYWQEAFEYNSIDYLLKPIKRERLEAALEKYRELAAYFSRRYKDLLEYRGAAGNGRGSTIAREKFLVRRGTEFVGIGVEEIAFFYASHKMVCLMRKDGAKFILDQSLAEVEKEVGVGMFNRLNRKYLVNRSAIRKVSVLPKSKLLIEVEPAVKEELVVSSENSAAFKMWFGR